MKKKENKALQITMYILIFLLIAPVFILILWSFSKIWPWPHLFPLEYGLRGYKHLLDPSSRSLGILGFSIVLSAVVTFITLMISIPAARAIGLYQFKGKNIIEMLILAPIIVPTVAVAMGIHLAFMRLGLANTCLGVVLVHLIPCLPYGIRILTSVFEIVGESMEIQARVLGANAIQTFFYITLPLIAPGLVSAAGMVFIVSFSQYFLTFLIGGGRIITFSMVMFPYIQSGDRMMASVYSIAFMVASFLFLFAVEKMVKTYYRTENHFYL